MCAQFIKQRKGRQRRIRLNFKGSLLLQKIYPRPARKVLERLAKFLNIVDCERLKHPLHQSVTHSKLLRFMQAKYNGMS